MNERIKQLAEQAGLKWKAQPPHYTNTNNPIDFPVSANRDLEKFAELIVRECVAICQDTDGEDNTDARSGRQDCAVEIREHFGVKEE